MRTSLSRPELAEYVARLMANQLPDGRTPTLSGRVLDLALDRLEHCFSRIERKYYRDAAAGAVLDHLNGDHMATLLYFLANTSWREEGNEGLATRLFYLNKIMHGLDLFYSVTMPDVFLLVHPVGTVLGNAAYADYLVVYQNCTVGAVTTVYPAFGVGTILYSRSSVLGRCRLGDDVVVAAGAMLIDRDAPRSTVVLGQHPANRFVPNGRSVRQRCFDALPATGNEEPS